ncbi:MAG: hypothetical protein HAW61_00920, partial [Candidatus Portiera sp.]|nr:hypothetical protein [Portiera sp.]
MQEIIASSLNRVLESLYKKGLLAEELHPNNAKNSPSKRQKIQVSVVPPNIKGDYST